MMELKNMLYATRCDNGACRRTAIYAIKRKGTPANMEMHLCEKCLKEMYGIFMRVAEPSRTAGRERKADADGNVNAKEANRCAAMVIKEGAESRISAESRAKEKEDGKDVE